MSKSYNFLFCSIILLHVIYVSMLFLTGVLVYLHYVIAPTYRHDESFFVETPESCPPSTAIYEDLIIPADMSSQDVLRQTNHHGSAMVQNVISKPTLASLRQKIVKLNKEKLNLFVLAGNHRSHVKLSHRETGPVLKELAAHPILRPLIEGLMGPAASLISMDAITAYPGAVAQFWHHDNDLSVRNYPEQYVPSYTVVIPLQDTTSAMGATGICPGTHICEYPTPPMDVSGYQSTWNASPELQEEYDSFDQWMKQKIPYCFLRAETKTGDVFIYSTEMFHRGEAHVDPNAMDRLVLFVTFAGSRTGPKDRRLYPAGAPLVMDLDSYGHTLDDFDKSSEWQPWQAFGIGNAQREGRIPWNILDILAIMWNREADNDSVNIEEMQEFTAEYLEEQTWRAVKIAKMSLVLYATSVAALLAVYTSRSMIKKLFGKTDAQGKEKFY